MMRYQYSGLQAGHPLLSWKSGPPPQTRAPIASLGSLGEPTLVMPRAGAPEPINCAVVGDPGCSPGTGMGGFTIDSIRGALVVPGQKVLQIVTGRTPENNISMAATAGLAYVAYRLYKAFKKR